MVEIDNRLKNISSRMTENITVRNQRLKLILVRILSILDDDMLDRIYSEIMFISIYDGCYLDHYFLTMDGVPMNLVILDKTVKNHSEKIIVHIILHELGHYYYGHNDVIESSIIGKRLTKSFAKKLKDRHEKEAEFFANKWGLKYFSEFKKRIPREYHLKVK